jgi:hypothetical protein
MSIPAWIEVPHRREERDRQSQRELVVSAGDDDNGLIQDLPTQIGVRGFC